MAVAGVSGQHEEEPGNQQRVTLLTFINKLGPSLITSLSVTLSMLSSDSCVIPHHLFISVWSRLTVMVHPPPHLFNSVTISIQFMVWSDHNVLFSRAQTLQNMKWWLCHQSYFVFMNLLFSASLPLASHFLLIQNQCPTFISILLF